MDETAIARTILQSVWPAEYDAVDEEDIELLQEGVQNHTPLSEFMVSVEGGEPFELERIFAILYYGLGIIHLTLKLYERSKCTHTKEELIAEVSKEETINSQPSVIESAQAKEQINSVVEQVINIKS